MDDSSATNDNDLTLRMGRGGQGTSKANKAKLALLEANMLLFLIMPGAAKKEFLVLIYEFLCHLGFTWVSDANSDEENDFDDDTEFDPVKSLMACIRGNAMKQDAYQDGCFYRLVMHVTGAPRIKCRWFRRGETAQDWYEVSEEGMQSENPWNLVDDSPRSQFCKIAPQVVAVPETLFPLLEQKPKQLSNSTAGKCY